MNKKPKQLKRDLGGLTDRLDYEFKDWPLLKLALTHASAASSTKGQPTNERLEFLGDRVLALVISADLLERFPNAKEGELARRFNSLVRRETCGEIAEQIDLNNYILSGPKERASSAGRNTSILGNALEALLGAIYLDGGYDAAQKIILQLWSQHMNQSGDVRPDAKTALQEWAQSLGRGLPVYTLLERTGPDHDPQFVIEVVVDGYKPASAHGASKRLASQEAAKLLLEREKVW